MTVQIEQKGSTDSILRISFSNGTLNFDVENFTTDELNMYL